ncbi:MAG: GNAT family N-acetyltransferase [Flavobacteriaceae bacterium]|jgi:RimJ/RimL family protein N-acetyltransferase|nr:GNAT family N-acetyltransferase [Flavobacteriaceae bacterium]
MIKLTPFTLDDIAIMLDWNFTADELVQFGGDAFTYPLTKEQVVSFLNLPNSQLYKVIDQQVNQVIGVGEIVTMEDQSTKLARIVIGDRNSRGKGYGQKMMQAFVDYCIEELHSPLITLNVFEWNIGAIKCYEKIGFVFTNDAPRAFELPNGITHYSKRMDYIVRK